MIARWNDEGGRGRSPTRLGRIRHVPEWDSYAPTMAEAEAASRFRGKVNVDAVAMLRTGTYAATSSKVIAQDVVKQWQPGTIVAKEIAVTAFFAFLTAIGELN